MLRLVSVVVLGLLVAGCQSAPPVKPPADSAVEPVAAATSAVIEGRAFYLERIAPPSGATLDVRLVANAETDQPVTLAHQSFADLAGPPFDFALAYDPARIDEAASYALRATLRDGRGHLVFLTPVRVAVTPGTRQVVEMRLQRSTLP